jgi:hypothetical protein
MQYTGINHALLWQHAIGMARTSIRTGTPVRHLVVNHPFFADAANHADIARITGGGEMVDEYLMKNDRTMSEANRNKMGARAGWLGYVNIAVDRINE